MCTGITTLAPAVCKGHYWHFSAPPPLQVPECCIDVCFRGAMSGESFAIFR